MNTFPTERHVCGEVRKLAEAFLDHELVREEEIEVLRHVEACRNCRDVIENQLRWKQRLWTAAREIRAPVSLVRKIEWAIREHRAY
jgi:predicted anti-sigma-YlaC factor YlaD